MQSKLFRFALVVGLLFSMCFAVLADTIRLKDGSVVKGKVLGFKDGQFTVLIGEGGRQRQMSFFAEEIDKIEFDTLIVAKPSTTTQAEVATPSPAPKTNYPTNQNVIIVGGNRNPSTTATTPKPTETPKSTNSNVSSGGDSMGTSSSKPKPVVVNSLVLADNTSNGWKNSGWVVKKGQRIKITGSGRISLGNGRYSTPEGVSSIADATKLKKDEATGALLAVIGDDNNDFIFVGNSREFVAQRDGVLFLGINEGNLDDNSGAFNVTIEIDPNVK
jgi:PA-IL-like protein